MTSNTTNNTKKSSLQDTFAARVAWRLRQIIGAGDQEERAMSRYLEDLLWRTEFELRWFRRHDGEYRCVPAGLRELLRAAYDAGYRAAKGD